MYLRTTHLRTLHFPDLALFRNESGYSTIVRAALIRAYAALRAGPDDLTAYARAVDAVTPTLGMPMAERQRVRVWYVLGTAHAAVGDYKTATFWLGDAIDLACDLLDDPDDLLGPGDLLDLLYVRGAVHRGTSRYSEMADDYREFLTLIEPQHQSPDALEAPLTLEVWVQLGGAEFFMAHYDEAQHHLDTARELLSAITHLGITSETRLVEGTLEWFQALLDRWRGIPKLALAAASNAARVYRELGAPISAARAQLIVADILLDLAMQQPTAQTQQIQANLAQPLIAEGVRLVGASGDPVGAALADLTDARWSRLAGRSGDRIGAIESAIRLGHELEDEAILAQAFTALGDELVAQGQTESGIYRYRDVQGLLDGSDVPALGVWARRALHKEWEHNI